jgi:hypothetical protein
LVGLTSSSTLYVFRIESFKAEFLNHRDLETFSPGRGTLEKFKIYQKLHKNEVSESTKTIEKSIAGTIGHNTKSYRDKRLKNNFTWTWTRKG